MVEHFFFVDLAQGADAGEGAPDDVLEASFVTLEEEVEVGILAGQGAAGMEQALEVVGGRPASISTVLCGVTRTHNALRVEMGRKEGNDEPVASWATSFTRLVGDSGR